MSINKTQDLIEAISQALNRYPGKKIVVLTKGEDRALSLFKRLEAYLGNLVKGSFPARTNQYLWLFNDARVDFLSLDPLEPHVTCGLRANIMYIDNELDQTELWREIIAPIMSVRIAPGDPLPDRKLVQFDYEKRLATY